jgi:hypothetical protein
MPLAEVAYAAALALAAVFGWAGLAKLRDRHVTAAAFRDVGLAAPERLAVAVPGLELALAAALVLVPAEAALVTVAVLAGFTTFLVRARRAGVEGGCGCFGGTRRQPVPAAELGRNALLAAGALTASFAAGPVVPGPGALALVAAVAAGGGGLLALAARRRGRPTRART